MKKIKFYCEKCNAKLGVESSYSGTFIDCPECKVSLLIPTFDISEKTEISHYITEEQRSISRMGEMWIANNSKTNKKVMLNILSPEIITKGDFLDLFKKEVYNNSNIKHPNIVSNYDFNFKNGYYFLSMDYAQGQRLDLKIEKKKISELNALKIIRLIANALQYTWNKFNIIHGDLQLKDILIDSSGDIKILNVGVLKTFLELECEFPSDNIDFHTDISSLGKIFEQIVDIEKLSNNGKSLMENMIVLNLNSSYKTIEELILEIEKVEISLDPNKKLSEIYEKPTIKENELEAFSYPKLVMIGIAFVAIIGIIALNIKPSEKKTAIDDLLSLDSIVKNSEFSLPNKKIIFDDNTKGDIENIPNMGNNDDIMIAMYASSEKFCNENPNNFVESINLLKKILTLYPKTEYAEKAQNKIKEIETAQEEYIALQNEDFLKKQKNIAELKSKLIEEAKELEAINLTNEENIKKEFGKLLYGDVEKTLEKLDLLDSNTSIENIKLIIADIKNANNIILNTLREKIGENIDLYATNEKYKKTHLVNIDDDNRLTIEYLATGTKITQKIKISDLSNINKVMFFEPANPVTKSIYGGILAIKDYRFDDAESYISQTEDFAEIFNNEFQIIKQTYAEKIEKEKEEKLKEKATLEFSQLEKFVNNSIASNNLKEIIIDKIKSYQDEYPDMYDVELDSMMFKFDEKLSSKKEKENEHLKAIYNKNKLRALRKKIRTADELISIMTLFNPKIKVRKDKKKKGGIKNTDPNRYGSISNRSGLWYIKLDSSNIIDMTPFTILTIRLLSIANNPIEILPKKLNVANLNIANTKILDLSPLKGCRLTNLNITGTPIVDLSGLTGVSSLKEITLDALNLKNIKDLSVMKKIKKLDYILVVNNNKIMKYELKKFLSRDKSKDPIVPIVEENNEEGESIDENETTESNNNKE